MIFDKMRYHILKRFFVVINRLKIYAHTGVRPSHFNVLGAFFIRVKGVLEIGVNFSGNGGRYFNPIGGSDSCLRFIINKKGRLSIGSKVGMSNVSIVCWELIEIGDNTIIGGGTCLWDTDFHSINTSARCYGDDVPETRPIIIGENVFIGGGCVLLKGTRIGENSVIAAGSVVTGSIPKNELWGGNPCKFIKKLN